MSDIPKILITAKINESESTRYLQDDINKITRSLTPIDIPFQFNLNDSEKVRQQIQQLVSKITKNKGEVINYKINLDENDNAIKALVTYKNQFNEVTQSVLKLKETEQELPDGTKLYEWVETHKTLSQNIEKTIQENEKFIESERKVSNAIAEISAKWNLLKTQADKSNLTLNTENISKLTEALNFQDVESARHYLSLLRTEYQQLNATMQKGLPENAIENLNNKIANLGTNIETLKYKFQRLGNSQFIPTDVNSQIESLKNELQEINNISDPNEKITAYNKLVASIQSLNNVYKTAAEQTRLFNQEQNLVVDRYKLINRIDAWATQNSKALPYVADKLELIKSKVKDADKATLTNLTKQFQNVTKAAEYMGVTGRTIIGEIVNDIKKMANWAIGGSVIFGSVREFKKGVEAIKELNSALTTISMTTNSTKEQLTELGNVIVDTATRLGTNVSNISQIAEVYANINETTESIAEKIQPAALLATSGEMTGSEASTILQSLKNQFDLTDDAAQHLVDAIEKISASLKMDFSTGIRNIAAAVEEAGSLAKEAGEDFETFAAQVSVITENTGESGDTVGASLKQQFARISRAYSGDVTAEEISAADKALQSIGIHVRDTNGEFKDISETLTELYHKWDDLTSVEKSYVAEQIAGTRRKNDFIVLMNNYNEVLDLATQAENSNGFALEVNAKRLESIQAKTEAFNASVIRLWTTLINSDAIKTTVDLGTNLVNVFTKLNQTIGAFPPLMGAVAAALSGFKNIGMIYA